MSYILDALRRADAERERGSVPGIHTQPMAVASDAPQSPVPGRRWLWIGLGAGVGLVAALAALVATRDTPYAAPVASPSASASLAASPPPAAAAPERTPPVAAPMPAPAALAPPAPVPLPKVAAAHKSAADAGPAARIYARDELPEPIRSQLPALAIGGSMYSPNPANRTLIIDGRVVREGEQIGPDLSLEQIKLKGAVLKFRGYLYEIAF